MFMPLVEGQMVQQQYRYRTLNVYAHCSSLFIYGLASWQHGSRVSEKMSSPQWQSFLMQTDPDFNCPSVASLVLKLASLP